MSNNIIFNKKLEEYNKKYRNGKYRLLKYTKKEVEQYDKVANQTIKTKNYLLKGRKWALIGDTYYEIPTAPRPLWFRNLNAGVKAISCCLVGGAAIGGAGYGIYAATNAKGGHVEPIFTGEVTEAEWNNAIKLVTNESDNRNFTCLVTTLVDQYKYLEKGLTEEIKVVKDGSERNRGYRKKEGSSYYEYGINKWNHMSGDDAGFSWQETIEEPIRLDKFEDAQSKFTFSNGKYKYEIPEELKVEATSIYIEFTKDKIISKVIIENENAISLEGKPVQYVYEFNNYGKTVVEDLPDPEPEYSRLFTFALNEVTETVTLTSVTSEFMEERPDNVEVPEEIDGDYCGGCGGEKYTVDSIGDHVFSGVDFTTTISAPGVSFFGQDCLSGSGIAGVECAPNAVLYAGNGNEYKVGEMQANEVAALFKNELKESALTKPDYADYFNFEITSEEEGTLKATLKESKEGYISVPETIYGNFFAGGTVGKEYIVTEIGQFPKDISEGLTYICIPEFVTQINKGTFINCTNVSCVYIDDFKSKWRVEGKGEGVDVSHPEYNAPKFRTGGEWENVDLIRDSKEEKFFELYSQFSDNFQNSVNQYEYDDVIFGLENYQTYCGVHYSIDSSNGARSFKAVINDDQRGLYGHEVSFAGGDLTYYEDSTKGIKAKIEEYKSNGGIIKYTFGSNDTLCGFKVFSNSELIAKYEFNSNGYATCVHSNELESDIYAGYYGEDPKCEPIKLLKKGNAYTNESSAQLYNSYEQTFEINVEKDTPVNKIIFSDQDTTVGFSFVKVLVDGKEVPYTMEGSNVIKLSNAVTKAGSKIEIITIPEILDGTAAYYVAVTATYADEPVPGEWTEITRDVFKDDFKKAVAAYVESNFEYDEAQITSLVIAGETKQVDFLDYSPNSCFVVATDGTMLDVSIFAYINSIDKLFPTSGNCSYYVNNSTNEARAVNNDTSDELIFNSFGHVTRTIKGDTITYNGDPSSKGIYADSTGATKSMTIDLCTNYNTHLISTSTITCGGMTVTQNGVAIDPKSYFSEFKVVVDGKTITSSLEDNYIKFGDSGATGNNFVVKFKCISKHSEVSNVKFEYTINA